MEKNAEAKLVDRNNVYLTLHMCKQTCMSVNSKILLTISVVVALVVGFSIGAFVYAPMVAPTTTITPVSAIMDWTIYGEHAPFASAIGNGYYGTQGLSVTLLPSNGGADALRKVVAGDAQFGRATVDTVTEAYAQNPNLNVKIILMQEIVTPESLCYVNGKYSTPSQLDGKKIGVVPGSAQDAFFNVILSTLGINSGSVQRVDLGFSQLLSGLATSQIDAANCFYADLPSYNAVASQYHETVSAWPLATFGYSAIGNAIFTTTQMISQHPDVVRKFVQATLQGEVYAVQNPQSAVNMLATQFPTLNATTELATWQDYMPFYFNQQVKQNGLGYVTTQDISADINLTVHTMNISSTISPQNIYDGTFLPSQLPTISSSSIPSLPTSIIPVLQTAQINKPLTQGLHP